MRPPCERSRRTCRSCTSRRTAPERSRSSELRTRSAQGRGRARRCDGVTLTKAVVLAQAVTLDPARSALLPHHTGLPPSPLLPVGNRALLCHALDWLAQAGIREMAVIVPQQLLGQAREVVADGQGIQSV